MTIAAKNNPTALIREALTLLGKENLILIVHDAGFPSRQDENTGRGNPYGAGAWDFILFAERLGFSGIQLGPQGQTSPVNASPYDGTVFSKNILSIDLKPLTDPGGYWCGLLLPAIYERIVRQAPDVRIGPYPATAYAYVFSAYRQALREVFDTFERRRADEPGNAGLQRLAADFEAFREANAGWLETDALFEALKREHGADNWRAWNSERDRQLLAGPGRQSPAAKARIQELETTHAWLMAFYRFCQFVVHRQHGEWQKRLAERGLKTFGDLQVGYSLRDEWAWRDAFMTHYRMGAPPSRTNPDGQPWNYPILKPEQLRAIDDGSPALSLILRRTGKMLAEFDGIRIDHPHGIVDPWGYRTDTGDPYQAVRNGARIYGSPNLPDHPELAKYAIPTPDQINDDRPRHADDRVKALTPEQVDRYGVILDAIVRTAEAGGRNRKDILCEVLSTLPYPLQRVMEKYGMGRFRVTQKTDPTNPDDVYRSENAQPEDWVMTGNHDTPPVWLTVRRWAENDPRRLAQYAAYLAGQLEPEENRREAFRQALIDNPNRLVQAMFAQLFACPAKNVMVFFPDLLGMEAVYNKPGIVDEENWHLRVPDDFESFYQRQLSADRALNMPLVLALAMRARGAGFVQQHHNLLDQLEAFAPVS